MMKKIFFLFLAVAFLGACEKDDPAAVAPQTTNPQIILAPSGATDVTDLLTSPGNYTLNVDFGFGFASGTTYFDRDVEIMFDGATYEIVADQAGPNFVAVGNIDYPYTIPAPTGVIPFSGLNNPIEIDLASADYDYSITSRPSDLVVIKGSTPPLVINAYMYENLPDVQGDDLVFVMDWQDSDSNDLDCRIQTSTFTSVDTGYSVSRFEEVQLPGANADGSYTFNIRVWSASGTVPTKIFARHPDGTLEIFDYSLSVTGNFWTQEEFVLDIVKTGNTYVITEI